MTWEKSCGYPAAGTEPISIAGKELRRVWHLTERDKEAPDFSGLFTLDKARTCDIPKVKPLKWDVVSGRKHINDLHRLMVEIIEDMTGNSAPDSEDLMEFIEANYADLFSKGMKKSGTNA